MEKLEILCKPTKDFYELSDQEVKAIEEEIKDLLNANWINGVYIVVEKVKFTGTVEEEVVEGG